jgi:hypothetical protein
MLAMLSLVIAAAMLCISCGESRDQLQILLDGQGRMDAVALSSPSPFAGNSMFAHREAFG